MKIKKFLLLLILPLVFIITGCQANIVEKTSKDLNTYNIDIVYNEDHTLTCKQTFNYTNRTETTLENLMFHLYPRSFRQGASTSVVSSLNYDKCYYNGNSYGDIEITELKVNNEDTEIQITGNDEDIANVEFTTPLAPDGNADIYFEFKVTIPNINHRFGYGDDTINIANFYPVVCVYENGEFAIDSYHYNGDPFYSEVSNYNVNFTTPSNYVVATTGNVTSTTDSETTKTYSINALAVRDFAIVQSDKFNIVSDKINKTTVNYYYYKNQYPNEAIKASIDSVRTFNELFGEYPYETLNVVEADFVHGGMEYPNLVLISDAVDVQSDFINVIVHEIAHQWWYGLVGVNETKDAWIDEGLAEYSTALFFDNHGEYKILYNDIINDAITSYTLYVDVISSINGKINTKMNIPVNEYINEYEYTYMIYIKGTILFDDLSVIVGREKLIKALEKLCKQYRFKNITTDIFTESIKSYTHKNTDTFFTNYLNGDVIIGKLR